MGEGPKDRVGLIHQLATLPEHPESVPINSLVSVAGTPLEGREAPSGLELARSDVLAASVLSVLEMNVTVCKGGALSAARECMVYLSRLHK